MSSSRLPGKVMLDIGGQPMLALVVNRTRQANSVNQVVVATTTAPDDEPIAKYCTQHQISYTRGSLHDVLDRYYQTARRFKANVIVRVTADCPVIDPKLIDQTVAAFLGKQAKNDKQFLIRELSSPNPNEQPVTHNSQFPYDFAANRLPPPWGRTFPVGLDIEVCTFQALETAWHEAEKPHQREHVMPYLYDHRNRFRVLLLDYFEDHGAYRWTVDTPEDLDVVRKIYAHFGNRIDFAWLDVLELFNQKPELAQINAKVRHKAYDEVDKRQKVKDK
jgi:spore coat polysaccharide biosynthesis protein SpsF